MKKELNEKQKMFCLEYLKDFNGTRAYQTVYWWSSDSARRQASRLLTNVHIQDFLKVKTDNIADKLWLSAEWVLKNLKDVAEKCMEAQPVTFKNWKQVTTYVEDENWDEVKASVWRFDSAWANSALEKIWKYFKMFTDKVETEWSVNINVISFKKDSKWQN